ncbi:MAG: tellurite resistance/C4-dicarboxylate transporter family protein [Polyangiales bacterium]
MTTPVAAPASSSSAEDGLAGMHPAYFALVMATGIVSIASQLVGVPILPKALFALNLVFYPTLWVLTVLRAFRHRERFLTDVSHHGRAVGFFTIVAATCVLGSQCLVVAQRADIALWLWILGIVLYVVLVYSVFTILMVKENKPPLAEGLNGGWLVSVVAAQSVAVLGAQLAPSTTHADRILFFCLATWLGGGMLYLWIISLIFYRYMFFALAPSDLAPPYWINMGAAAISTLAGATLVAASAQSPVLVEILPFVRGMTLMWWATATWWIPMLVVLGVWRHVYRRFPLRYDPLYWGAVFPLGMYTAATVRLSRAVDAPYLFEIPRWFVFVAIAAWAVTFAGMSVQIARRVCG